MAMLDKARSGLETVLVTLVDEEHKERCRACLLYEENAALHRRIRELTRVDARPVGS
jgi:hypothetical protein